MAYRRCRVLVFASRIAASKRDLRDVYENDSELEDDVRFLLKRQKAVSVNSNSSRSPADRAEALWYERTVHDLDLEYARPTVTTPNDPEYAAAPPSSGHIPRPAPAAAPPPLSVASHQEEFDQLRASTAASEVELKKYCKHARRIMGNLQRVKELREIQKEELKAVQEERAELENAIVESEKKRARQTRRLEHGRQLLRTLITADEYDEFVANYSQDAPKAKPSLPAGIDNHTVINAIRQVDWDRNHRNMKAHLKGGRTTGFEWVEHE
uniref:Uncharacterized protein n=1 Tax=Mycena chlorophos TaxID=658473 RepID=A0ABQ0LGD6_MYCCL|nr:predicted protein [Mycena chlorophos]